MSPLLFNLYINDLCDDINSTELGVSIGEEKVNMLMYADDLVLLGENENDLQSLLDVLYKWCDNWKEVSIYPVTGCARRLKPLFNPTMTTNQNRSFNACCQCLFLALIHGTE